MHTDTDSLAKILWEYLMLRDPIEKADCIIGLGSYDIRVAERSAELYLQGWAPLLVFSGGIGRLTPPEWQMPEADKYAEVALSMGVPKEAILIENRSTNTGENISFTRKLLEEKHIDVHSIILIHKPYMERRAYAVLKKQWPEPRVISTSPLVDYEDYPNDVVGKEEMIEVIVGDMQRIKEYAHKGFIIPQEIPPKVWDAYEQLVARGYSKYLI